MKKLKLYDTYKKKLVEFKPIEKGKVKIYNCGPTVYDYLTIGNLRTYVFADILRRSLEYLGYDVTQVMNITDVGHLTMTEVQKKSAELAGEKLEITDTDEGLDRMEKAAKREGLSVEEVAQKYTEAIFGKNYEKKKGLGDDGDFGKLNIKKPHHLPKATEYIDEQIEFIKQLEKKGFTYKTKQAVYFDVQKFPRYEELVGQSFEDMKKGGRADTSDPERKHPADFRLWQIDPDHPMHWPSPWGEGYPGWHIECSAMSRKLLGQPIDIHTGGEDHIKLHHVDEMAQSECAYDAPLANHWMHGAFLTVDGGRMGKSLGNAYTLKDLKEKGFDPLDLRYLFMQAHYRKKQDFTWEALEAARSARLKMVETFRPSLVAYRISPSSEWKERFTSTLRNDLNIPEALAVVWDLIKSDGKKAGKYATLLGFDRVLGLGLDKVKSQKSEVKNKNEIEGLVSQREEARKKEDWKKADEIRDELKGKYNVELEDTDEGTEWRVK